MADILLVEDDETLGMTLDMTLQANGHDVLWCTTLASAHEATKRVSHGLIILDLGLPDGDGLHLCKVIREQGNIAPILILSARSNLDDRVDGLTSGADDYMTKPFELPELLARVEALLRRQDWHDGQEEEATQVGCLRVDFTRREAHVGDERVPLTDLEFRLIRYFLDHADKAVPRKDLLRHVWHLPESTKTRTVDVFISRLRRHIEEDSSQPKHLINVRGVGYRLVREEKRRSRP